MTDKQIINQEEAIKMIKKLNEKLKNVDDYIVELRSNFYRMKQDLDRKEQECESWKTLIDEAQLEQRKLEQQLDQLKKENDKLKKQLESAKGLVTVGNKQLMEALFELQKQQHENCHFDKIKELTKEM